ncbi:DDB1- and CUL4-associated factor 17-like [Clavelina lepadiformis]|uniref:DDB1- and CUL4-associated factor 17-like n=1 Tax=Clavelina lepadiformis TaxID=159417 RepID=UPI0040421B5A
MQNHPKYKCIHISKILRNREYGLASNAFQNRSLKLPDNSHTDLEVLRSLFCDKYAYLETIACRKIQRAKAPAFCHGRLFTENYQTWFNLFTGPSSGPLLMTSNVFAGNCCSTQHDASRSDNSIPRVKVVDVACIIPPFSSKPPSSHAWRGPRLLMLTKLGWLYQADLDTCKILNKIFIPTKEYTTSIFKATDTTFIHSDILDHVHVGEPPHSYQYITINRESESVVIKSSRRYCQQCGSSMVAFCILSIYPLQVENHFLVSVPTQTNNPAVSADVVNDLFIVTVTRASKISFYSLKDVMNEHHHKRYFPLNEQVKVLTPCGLRKWRLACVGDESVGIPYTTRKIELKTTVTFKNAPCLFKTAAMKHSLQIGGVPYHYLVSANKTGTSWSLKHLLQDTEASTGKIQVQERWDGSHWHGVRFHGDDTGRFIRQDVSSLDMLTIQHQPNQASEEDKSLSALDEKDKAGTSCVMCCRVVKSFTINVKPDFPSKSSDVEWQYPSNPDRPSLPPHTITSFGRPSRKPVRWFSYKASLHSSEEYESYLLVSVEYEQELNLLVLVYYRPIDIAKPGWANVEGHSELVVSLFDNYFGGLLGTFLLDEDASPSDHDSLSLTVDQDTFVYTRLRANDNRLLYKIMRLHRKYGNS